MARRGQHERPDWRDDEVLRLVREHELLVRSYLTSIGCPAERVEDLAQETFLRLLSNPIEDRGRAHMRSYLCVTARNLFRNSLRADSAKPTHEELDRAWLAFEGTDGGSAYLDALRSCLESLPERANQALRLRFASNMSRSAIAEEMQLSLGGVKSLLLRGKAALRACIQRRLGADTIDSVEAAR